MAYVHREREMSSPTVVFETSVPEDLYLTLQAQGVHRQTMAEDALRLLAMRYFQKHVLSLGKAARLANMNLWEFTDYLSQNGVSVIDLDEDELAAEFAAVEQLVNELKT